MEPAELWRRWYKRGLTKQSAERFEVRANNGRLWLPLHNPYGEEIGSQGWGPSSEDSKYKIVLFAHTSQKLCLFNLHRVRGVGGRVFVTEGTLDAVAVTQVGFPCVATFGTTPGLSPERLVVLSRYFDHIIYMADRDEDKDTGLEAGQKAVSISLELGIRVDCFASTVKRVSKPGLCKDANEVLEERGMEALIELLRNADTLFGGDKNE